MDGDEKGSCGTAVCDGGPGDVAEGEAVASGDVAPTPADGEPGEVDRAQDVRPVEASVDLSSEPDDSAPDDVVPDASVPAPDETVSDDLAADVSEPESHETVPDDSAPDVLEPESDESISDDSAPDDDSVSDTANSDGAPDEPETVEPEVVAGAATDTASDAATDAPTRRLRPYLRRGVVALVAAGFVALGVGAFTWISPSAEVADRRFVDAAQSKGHVVAPEQQPLIVSAARKICDRRVNHETDSERRATALTSDEIAAVGTAFGADTRDFTTLALETYCSS